MSLPEPIRMGNPLNAMNSGSGLYKLGAVDAEFAPTDIEVAHIEAQLVGPDLGDAEKQLLSVAGDEQEERKALLAQSAAYDAIADGMNAKTSKGFVKEYIDLHTALGDGASFAQQNLRSFGAPDATTRGPSSNLIRKDLLSHDLVAEDDDDLLCDFAPHAMQSDGSLGLVGTDGITVSMPVSPKVTKGTGTACDKANADQHAELLRQHSLSNEDSMAYRRPVTDACLSDSWQALDFEHARNDNNLGSITQLRQQYQRVFGKETSSNNRQWLLRRLAEINRTCGSDDVDDDADDSGDFYSGDGSDDAGDSSPFTDASAGTHTDFFGAGESARVRRNSMSKSDSQIGERGQRHNGKNKRGSSNDSDKSSNDLSASGKKRKGGHHSDSDDQQEGEESPVKSRNTGGGHYRGGGGGKGASPRGRDAVGANGRRSKHHNPWALEEAEALVDGVARCGGGKWADIKKLGFPAIEHRTAVDLKDKWRNLLRIAMLPHQPVKSAGDKKREIPAELLNRVRDLAAKQAKKAAADGRSRTGGR